MHTIGTLSYEELHSKIGELISREKEESDRSTSYFSPLLFRGQSNSEWKLETTLERFLPEAIGQNEYSTTVSLLRKSIENAMEVSLPDGSTSIESSDYGPPAEYPLMVYARHHGFPSPLLDWTESFYIALFFAFSDAPREGDGRAAVFIYREHCGNGKSNRLSRPHIIGLGPNIRAHKRHFQQQAWYTICRREAEGRRLVYASHEDAFGSDRSNQDRLWKFTIPWNQKTRVLEELDRMNVNAFTLFGSMDSLMSTLSARLLKPRVRKK